MPALDDHQRLPEHWAVLLLGHQNQAATAPNG
jgi:hypothetical protein